MDAARREGHEQAGRRFDHLDRHVVARDQAAESVGDALEDAARVERRQQRLGDLEELPLTAQLLLQRQCLLAEAHRRVGVRHRLGGQAGVDHEQAQVVVGEPVEAELREHEHAEDLVVEDHRREQHRFVEVVLGAGDGRGARVGGGISQPLGDPVLGDPAGDALTQRHPQLVGRLVDVLADLAEHRDRDEVTVDEPVHPGVVVVDELAQLGRDRLADLGHARQAAQAGAELLDRLELGRPGRHPLVVLRRPDGDARLGRQRPDRVEVVGRPLVRLVVVDVEHPEQLRAVQERCRAQRVEPFLDDGGADVLAARVVAVADREERPARGDRGRRQGPGRDVADAVQIGRRQATADLGRHVAVALLEEDRSPVAFEQHHGVVDEPGQDPVQVEPAADVAGDPAERLGPVEQVPDRLRPLGAADDRADPVTHDAGDVEVARIEGAARLADDQQRAPRTAVTRDRHRQLGPSVRHDRERGIARVVAQQDGGEGPAAAAVPAGGESQRPTEQAGSQRDIEETLGTAHRAELGTRHRPRRQVIALRLPDGDEMVAVRVTDGPDHRVEGLVRVVGRVDRAGDRRQDRQVELVPLGVERVRRRRQRLAPPAAGEPGGGRGIDRPPAAPRAGRRGGDAVDRAGLGRREEALEIAQPVASVAARVDPVVAQPARVTPGPDRVRMDAKQPSGLGDRQRGIGWSGRQGGRHDLIRGNVKLVARA